MAKKKTNNRLAYGLCKKYGIKLPKDAPPRVAWEMLEKKTGITMLDAYTNLEYQEEMEKSTSLYDCNSSEDEWEYPDSKKSIESIAFNAISLKRKKLNKFGSIVLTVTTYNGDYTIVLHNADKDYEIEIIYFEEK